MDNIAGQQQKLCTGQGTGQHATRCAEEHRFSDIGSHLISPAWSSLKRSVLFPHGTIFRSVTLLTQPWRASTLSSNCSKGSRSCPSPAAVQRLADLDHHRKLGVLVVQHVHVVQPANQNVSIWWLHAVEVGAVLVQVPVGDGQSQEGAAPQAGLAPKAARGAFPQLGRPAMPMLAAGSEVRAVTLPYTGRGASLSPPYISAMAPARFPLISCSTAAARWGSRGPRCSRTCSLWGGAAGPR